MDTLFLSKLVKKEGKVYAFDIQQQAVQFTLNLLKEHECISQVEIFQQCHNSFTEHLPQELKGKISAVMGNLGYLPKGNHLITTDPGTTCAALVKAYEWLSINGVISVITYQGHKGGVEENTAVKKSDPQVSMGLYHRVWEQKGRLTNTLYDQEEVNGSTRSISSS
jgi:16S rRNA C1402 N4-methylase RsmH